MSPNQLKAPLLRIASLIVWMPIWGAVTVAQQPEPRETRLLNGSAWYFTGVKDGAELPEIDSDAFAHAVWRSVSVPHNFQTRPAYDTLVKTWYRRSLSIGPSEAGRELYLVFEGAATVADVYVNGQHLGQHRGAYTRFVFDATAALHSGADNELAVLVDDSREDTADTLPVSRTELYKVWGGLYRNVWLVSTAPVHIDPTDDAGPGVYLTPSEVSEASAKLGIRALLRNTSTTDVQAEVRARILDPSGQEVKTVTDSTTIPADGRATAELSTAIDQPRLWGPLNGQVYHVETSVLVNGRIQDEVTQPTGFRWINWDWKSGAVTVNGKAVRLYGANLHQEVEEKGSAVSPDDLRANFDDIKDLGINFLRLPHYPHAQLEYDLCDQDGILCWAEDGHSNPLDIVSPTAAKIATEMVKQNYNHPSIVLWSAGNEARSGPADECIPIIKALDQTRPVVVANMASSLADFHTANKYPGWYNGNMRDFVPRGFYSEIGAGGIVTTHCDYNKCDWTVNKYEPEEYQQLFAEHLFQQAFHGDDDQLGLLCWWCLREFNDGKYKAPVGINSKGLITYGGSKKDVYYLYRSFLRPATPTIWITSKRYFLRKGAVDNGIKVYSNAPRLTLTLNGEMISTIENGRYVIPNGPWALHTEKSNTPAPYQAEKVDNVFYWPIALRTGRNTVSATDDRGNSDTATIYFEGDGGAPERPDTESPIRDLSSTNPNNPAYLMEMPAQPQWPIYSDLDSTADNSWNQILPELQNASWIALRRVTKTDEATSVSFTTAKPCHVYVVATKTDALPAFETNGGFQEVEGGTTLWRDNALLLVPAQLYVRLATTGEKIQLDLGDRDAVVLIK